MHNVVVLALFVVGLTASTSAAQEIDVRALNRTTAITNNETITTRSQTNSASNTLHQKGGNAEVALQGFYLSASGSGSFANINGKFGLYLSNSLELGVMPSFSIVSTTTQSYFYWETTTSTTTTFGMGAFLSYYLGSASSPAIPYLGAEYYKADFSSTDPGALGPQLGVKIFVSRHVSLDVAGDCMFPLGNGSKGVDVLFGFGLGYII